jgi:nuclear pore complex protein Nup98-Nup96
VPLCADEPEERLDRLLQHHLSNTRLEPDAEGIPLATPSPSLNFASMVSLYLPSDHSFEASLFRLGHALFDDMDLQLADSVSQEVKSRVEGLRRKTALSAWLEEAVSSAVEADIRDNFTASAASTSFAYLTGNQVEKACEAAMDGGNANLATLIAQSGGDALFRADLQEQLRVWRDQKVDVHMDEHVRKLYALLSGIVDVLEGSSGKGIERCPDINVADGLDWKRAFGLYLWHGMPLDASIAQAFEVYDEMSRDAPGQMAPPQPWYIEQPPAVPSPWNLSPTSLPSDALYSIIRLFADPSCSLSDILNPLSFGPSPADCSLPWHLYIIFSRCLRSRDFADRGDPGQQNDEADGDTIEGHSPSADLLASSYAHQLEQQGMLQQAVFVLLHIEGSAG